MIKDKKYMPFFIGLAMAAGIFIGNKLNFADNSSRLFSSNSKKDKLNRLIDFIDYEYLEEVNTDSIVDLTVNGILDNLDPHSVYIPKSDMQRVSENMKGDFVGIGINFLKNGRFMSVIKTIENGPSEKAGIKGGDQIVMVNGDSLNARTLSESELISKLKGPIDSEVVLKVSRKGEPDLLEFKIKRGLIPIKSVDAAYMLTDNLGYIKINRFAESTYKEFKKELKKLKKLGATELALDLRNNPGGFLNIAEQIVDEFLEDDKLILYTKNKRGLIEKSYSTRKGDFENGQVYVLIDENSASASEIVAGALQDNDKGTIIGRRSYGKGLVQREMALGDGSAVRLTVSRYYTPTGRSIQRAYKKGGKDYYDDYANRISSGELVDAGKIKVADSLKFTTPKGKIVYGGGGIIPDVFVALDASMQNKTISYLLNRGWVRNFVFEELEKDRKAYDNISREDFISNFEILDDLVFDFRDYVNERRRSDLTFVAYSEEVKQYLKAELADQLYGSGIFYEVINKKDIMIDELLELSKN